MAAPNIGEQANEHGRHGKPRPRPALTDNGFTSKLLLLAAATSARRLRLGCSSGEGGVGKMASSRSMLCSACVPAVFPSGVLRVVPGPSSSVPSPAAAGLAGGLGTLRALGGRSDKSFSPGCRWTLSGGSRWVAPRKGGWGSVAPRSGPKKGNGWNGIVEAGGSPMGNGIPPGNMSDRLLAKVRFSSPLWLLGVVAVVLLLLLLMSSGECSGTPANDPNGTPASPPIAGNGLPG
uniref:Uncharacterized protein n=1 Tax=Anopheles coluzzii TaxID=1518534 RepID=A0A8W7P7B9_ANOCL